jgi:hypothetical protein
LYGIDYHHVRSRSVAPMALPVRAIRPTPT